MCYQNTHWERMMLHVKHASKDFSSVVIVVEDTDVLVLALWCIVSITCKVYMKRDNNTRVRVLDVANLGASLGNNMNQALLGMHAFIGCDTVSSFSGRGKLSSLRILENSSRFQSAFTELGDEPLLSDELFQSWRSSCVDFMHQ